MTRWQSFLSLFRRKPAGPSLEQMRAMVAECRRQAVRDKAKRSHLDPLLRDLTHACLRARKGRAA